MDTSEVIFALKDIIKGLSDSTETSADIRKTPIVIRNPDEFINESIKSLKDFIDANWERFKYARSYGRGLHIYSIIGPLIVTDIDKCADKVACAVNGYRGLTITRRYSGNTGSFGKDVIDIWF